MAIINTKLGAIKGNTLRGVSTFLGIPYAKPPIKELRWLPPESAPAWSGTYDAIHFPNQCPQPPLSEVFEFAQAPGEKNEDCLYLNIFAPEKSDQKLPVMVWIHGGGYTVGSANGCVGTVLAMENVVVVVAINYRLGIFGYFDLSRFGSKYAGSASLGFQDQIFALRWVRDNVDDFGGDPNNITIWGQSAGGGSVLALLGAPSAEGLFHKAIAFSPPHLLDSTVNNITPISKYLGIEKTELITHLQSMSADDLLSMQLDGIFTTMASIDGTIITNAPPDAIRKHGRSGVPLIVGCNKDEGSVLVAQDRDPGALKMMIAVFAAAISDRDSALYMEFLNKILPGGTLLQHMGRAWYDFFRSLSLQSAQAASDAGVGGWVYNFNVPTEHPLGTTHDSEKPFTFNLFKDGLSRYPYHNGKNPAICDIAESWSRTLTKFAHTGDPNGAGLPYWPQYNANSRSCLIVDIPPKVVVNPDGDTIEVYGIK